MYTHQAKHYGGPQRVFLVRDFKKIFLLKNLKKNFIEV